MSSVPIQNYIEIQDSEFKSLSQLIYDKFGIHLPEAKKTLLLARLQKILNQKEFVSFKQYYDFLITETTGEGLSSLVNQISTNFTYFYREPDHFNYYYKTLLPELTTLHARDKKLRMWCAGCSTGEESYLLVIMMMRYFGDVYHQWDAGILATDISQRALDKAITGVYKKEAIKKIPSIFRSTFFNHIDKQLVKIDPRVQKEVTFRRFNLMNKVFPFQSKFDTIFCRNVMIYFDAETKKQLVERFVNHLTVGGYFFIGHSETIGNSHSRLKYIKPSIYQRIN